MLVVVGSVDIVIIVVVVVGVVVVTVVHNDAVDYCFVVITYVVLVVGVDGVGWCCRRRC